MNLKGITALVTGGGTGIGRAICERLAREGAANIVVNYPSVDRDTWEPHALATASALEALGATVLPYCASVARSTEVDAMIAATRRRFGGLDVLVNNAGITRFIPHTDLSAVTDEIWETILGVNLTGAFYCSRAAADELRSRRGAIINMGSIGGMRGVSSSIPYGVSKAALLQLTRDLAIALAPEVRVNAIAPGLVTSGWAARGVGTEDAAAQEREFKQMTPLRSSVATSDVADAVVGLLNADAVTGECLIVDGGMHLLYGSLQSLGSQRAAPE